MKAPISASYTVVFVTLLLFSSLLYNSSLGQGQVEQQFQIYHSPNLGISIQYPSDWKLLEESNDKLRFVKQEGFVTADLNVEEIDQSDATLPEYANTRVDELRTQRPDFQLLSFEHTMISNDIPAQKVVYTFDREEDGKTNKVMRIWSINEGKLYTLAYVAESSQYDRYLPTFQKMVDSFSIGTGSRENNNEVSSFTPPVNDDGKCDRTSYPDPNVCIPPYPPDLNCPDVPYKNFKVTGNDPHGFNRDNDGIGCESSNGAPPPRPPPGDGKCDPSYPTVCIKSPPPNLNCEDVPYKNFKVTGTDPHGFDRDNDGLGCESADGDDDDNNNDNGNKTKPPVKCKKYEELIDGKCQPKYCPTVDGPIGPGGCPIPIPEPGPKPLPICDENTPPDVECRDEGDLDDCEEGFVDKGFGCEPIEDDGKDEPPTCTPDGPECLPCPEGVEAGWCADEDERGDFDCGDPDMENDPKCKDGEPVNGSEEEIEPEVVVNTKGAENEELPEEGEETEPTIIEEEEPVEEEESEPNKEVEEG